jgi:hypothetical protein
MIGQQKPADAQLPLAEARLAIGSLAAGLVGAADPAALSFQRLYEFVLHKLSLATVDDLNAARKVLGIMLEGLEAARDKAVAMERQGAIPPLDRARQVSLSA